jgi:hypothetical protein
VGRERAGQRLVRLQDLGRDAERLGSRPGREQERAAALGAAAGAQPGRDRHAARPAGRAEEQRLGKLHAAQAPLLDRRRARAQQPARDVERPARVAGEAEAPEGEHVAAGRADRNDHREGREGENDHGRERHARERVAEVAERADVARVDVGVVGGVEEEAEDRADGEDAGERERGVAQIPRAQPGDLGLGLGIGGRGAGDLRPPGAGVEQLVAQAAGVGGVDAVEPEAAVRIAVRAPGPDRHAHQAQDALQRVRADVDGPDAVARDGPQPATEQPAAHLDLVGGDAEARREPAEQPGGDRDRHPGEAPQGAVAVAAARDEQSEQRGRGARDLLDRVDEQHARAEPPPRRLRGRRLRRGRHVASSAWACVAAVSSSTSRSATSRSRPLISSAPAADAVVTVTFANPKSCSSGPRSVSTVWMRATGAIRRSWSNHPDCV